MLQLCAFIKLHLKVPSCSPQQNNHLGGKNRIIYTRASTPFNYSCVIYLSVQDGTFMFRWQLKIVLAINFCAKIIFLFRLKIVEILKFLFWSYVVQLKALFVTNIFISSAHQREISLKLSGMKKEHHSKRKRAEKPQKRSLAISVS